MSPPHPSRRRRRIPSLGLISLILLSPLGTTANADATASPWNVQPLSNPSYARLSVIDASSPGLHMNSLPVLNAHTEAMVPIMPVAGSGTGARTSSEVSTGPNIIPQAADVAVGIVTPQKAVTSPQKAKGIEGLKLDLQTFEGMLGGIKAPAIMMSKFRTRPFQVGEDEFEEFESAGRKSCDVQRGRCNLAVIRNDATGPNRGPGKGSQKGADSPRSAFTAVDCEQQKNQCEAAQRTAPIQTFNLENLGPDPAEPEFDLVCMA